MNNKRKMKKKIEKGGSNGLSFLSLIFERSSVFPLSFLYSAIAMRRTYLS
jgi:hypothetical protein